MIDLGALQAKAVELLDGLAEFGGAMVLADDGYIDATVEDRKRNDGFVVVVRQPQGFSPEVQTTACVFGTTSVVVHLIENPKRTQEAASLVVDMHTAVAAAVAALQAVDVDGEQYFRVTGISPVTADESEFAYEITATAAIAGM